MFVGFDCFEMLVFLYMSLYMPSEVSGIKILGEDAVEMAMGRARNARKFQRFRGKQLSLNTLDYPSYFKGSC